LPSIMQNSPSYLRINQHSILGRLTPPKKTKQ
jgi:hypothetical protein